MLEKYFEYKADKSKISQEFANEILQDKNIWHLLKSSSDNTVSYFETQGEAIRYVSNILLNAGIPEREVVIYLIYFTENGFMIDAWCSIPLKYNITLQPKEIKKIK